MLKNPNWKPAPDTTTVPDEEWRKILRRAAAHLRKYGWIRGSGAFGNGEDPRCAMGAIRAVSNTHSLDYAKAVRKLAEHVYGYANPALPECTVMGWNDKPHNDREQVIATMEAAAGAEAVIMTPEGGIVIDSSNWTGR